LHDTSKTALKGTFIELFVNIWKEKLSKIDKPNIYFRK
jgi:hypothetical protein